MKKGILGLVLFLFCALLIAQNRVSLNYYSDETYDAISATVEQRTQLRLLKQQTDSRIRETKNNNQLSDQEKQNKYKEIYGEGSVGYNGILSTEQKSVISRLLNEIHLQNQKNGVVPTIDKTTYNSKHYQMRMEVFKNVVPVKNAIVFLGNSIIERGPWHELFPGQIISNRGIGGDNVFGVLARLDDIIASKPSKVFIMIGVNDLAGRGWPVDFVYEHYLKIIDRFIKETPSTQLFLQTVLPLNDKMLTADRYKGKMEFIKAYNAKIQNLATAKKLTYVNLFDQFLDAEGQLKAMYTDDGIHLTAPAYKAWVEYLKKMKYL